MRTTILAKSLLIGSAFASAPLAAQQAEEPPATQQPTASVTLVAPAEPARPEPAAADPAAQPVAARPTASVTLEAQPPGSAPPVPAAATPGQPTASATITAPAEVPTTIATGVPTTIATGVPTTIATGVPAPPGAVVPATATATAPAPIAPAPLPPAPLAPAVPATATTLPATPAAGAVIDPATYQKRTEFDNTPWRFNMEQNGKRMTADEFTAWMEARGVRVARGPAAHRPANPTKDGMAGQGSTMPVGAVSTPTASTTVIVPPAPPADGLAPGSVEPTDAWTGTAPPDEVTTSATILVPVPASAEPVVEPMPAPPPVDGDEAQ